jgi:hypothetical protein
MFKINRLHCFQRRLSRLLSFGVLGLSLVAALPIAGPICQSPGLAQPRGAARSFAFRAWSLRPDVSGRIVSNELSLWGQSVVGLENRTVPSGGIGPELVAEGTADGYTCRPPRCADHPHAQSHPQSAL